MPFTGGFETGVLPNGDPYRANDPAALAWVHATETTSFLAAWVRYAEPSMSAGDRNRYFAEMAQIAQALGASPVPTSQAQAQALIGATRPALRFDARTKEVARLVLSQQSPSPFAEPLRRIAIQASIDLLPDWARRMHGLSLPMLGTPLVRAGTLGTAELLRWAFR